MDEQQQLQTFDRWMEENKGLFFKIVRAYAFTPQDQEDLFQEIAVQVWRSIPGFRNDAAVSTWLYRVGLYTAINWTRKERRHRQNSQPLVDMERTLTISAQPMDPRLDWLYEQIARFNEIDRSLVLLLLEGFSYKEMSEVLGISESNVGVKIHRIKQRLTESSQEVSQHGV